MRYSDQEKEAIRNYVSRNFEQAKNKKRLVLWGINIFIYLALLAISIGAAAGGELETALILMIIAGGMGLLVHSISAGTEGKQGDRQIRQQLIQEYRIRRFVGAEVEAEIFGAEASEEQVSKRKNDLNYRLSDDGELIPESEIEEALDNRRQQRRS